MKLWQKISLICSTVLMAIVLLMGGLLLGEAKGNILDLTYQQAADKQKSILSLLPPMIFPIAACCPGTWKVCCSVGETSPALTVLMLPTG